METEALKLMVRNACTARRGRLWPNGLGFDWRRWEYTYNEARGTWQALYRPEGYGKGSHTKLGYGPTPDTARIAATKVEE